MSKKKSKEARKEGITSSTKPRLIFIGIVLILGAILFSQLKIENKSYNNGDSNTAPTPVPDRIYTKGTANNCAADEKFIFTYPYDWKREDYLNHSFVLARTVSVHNETGGMSDETSRLIIDCEKISENTSLDEWTKYRLGSNMHWLDNAKQISVGGNPALSIKMPGSGAYDGDRILIINKGYGYDILLDGRFNDPNFFTTVINSFTFK